MVASFVFSPFPQPFVRNFVNTEVLGIGARVVQEDTRIAGYFHPELIRKATLKKNKKAKRPTRGQLAL
jgi:hypothetical protein